MRDGAHMFSFLKMNDGILRIMNITSRHLPGTYAILFRFRAAARIDSAARSALIIIGSFESPFVIGVSTGPALMVTTATPNLPIRFLRDSRYVLRAAFDAQ